MSKQDAYKAAGYDAKRPDVQSSKILKKAEIQNLIDIYTETRQRQSLITGANLQLATYEILEEAMAAGDRTGSLKAIDQLTKMTTGYKTEVKVDDVRKKDDEVKEALSPETLKDLFKAQRGLKVVGEDK